MKLLEKRRIARENESYRDGYRWAAGELLRGVAAEEVESYVYGSSDFFDRGAQKALRDWGAQ